MVNPSPHYPPLLGPLCPGRTPTAKDRAFAQRAISRAGNRIVEYIEYSHNKTLPTTALAIFYGTWQPAEPAANYSRTTSADNAVESDDEDEAEDYSLCEECGQVDDGTIGPANSFVDCNFCGTTTNQRSFGKATGTGAPIIAALRDTIHKDAVAQGLTAEAAQVYQRDITLGAYHMTDVAARTLTAAGISVPVVPTHEHSHGGHKRLEMSLYLTRWNAHLRPFRSVAVLFAKPSKFRALQQVAPNVVELWNQNIDQKDRTRYGQINFPDTTTVECLLLWDAGHYLKSAEVHQLFTRFPSVQVILAGCIIPPETKDGHASAYPGFYELRYTETEVEYYCEQESVPYRQPRNAWHWLHPGQRNHMGFNFYSEVVDSTIAHHLLSITRTAPAAPSTTTSFRIALTQPLPDLFFDDLQDYTRSGKPVVYSEALAELREYRANLKKGEAHDGISKMRSMRKQSKYAGQTEAVWETLRSMVEIVHKISLDEVRAHHIGDSFFSDAFRAIYKFLAPTEPQRTELIKQLAWKLLGMMLPKPLRVLMLATRTYHQVVTGQWTELGMSLATLALSSYIPWLGVALMASSVLRVGFGMWRTYREDRLKYLMKAFMSKPWYIEFEALKGYVDTSVESALVFSPLTEILEDGFLTIRCETCGFLHQPPTCRASVVRATPQPQVHLAEQISFGNVPPIEPGTMQLPRNLSPSRKGKEKQTDESELEPIDPTPGSNNVGEPAGGPTFGIDVPVTTAGEASESSSRTTAGETSLTGGLSDHSCARRVGCQYHNPNSNLLGHAWISCASGHGHWALNGTQPYAQPCHDCRSSGKAQPYHASSSRHPSEYFAHTNQALFFEHGAVDPVAPNTCALIAAAQALNTTPQQVWDRLFELLGEAGTRDLIERDGLDERFFALLAVRFDLAVTLTGKLSPATPRRVGYKSGRKVTFRRSQLDNGEWHWELDVSKEPRKKDISPGPAAGKALQRFLAEMEEFVDEHGGTVAGSWQGYQVSQERAKLLMRALKEGEEGLMKRQEGSVYEKKITNKLDAVLDLFPGKRINVRVVTGFAGCAKSSPIIEFLRTTLKQYGGKGIWKQCSPRKHLRQHWAKEVQPGRFAYQVGTWETAMLTSAQCIIIDEFSMMPPGYIDLIAALTSSCTHIIILGAPDQCKFHSTKKDSSLAAPGVMSEVDYLRRQVKSTYLLWTHRSPQVIATCFNVPSTSPIRGKVRTAPSLIAGVPVLAATEHEVNLLASTGQEVMSVPAAQGRTFQRLQLRVTRAWALAMDFGTLFSAIERVTDELILVPESGLQLSTIPIFAYLLKHQAEYDEMLDGTRERRCQVDYEQLAAPLLQGYEVIRMSETTRLEILGRRLANRSSGKYTPLWERAPAQTKTLLMSIVETPLVEETVPEPRSSMDEQRFATHLLAPTENFIIEQLLEGKNVDREAREMVNDAGMTRCHEEMETKLLERAAWFPKQLANDEALLQATIKKRLCKGTIDLNVADLQDSELAGYILYRNYCKLQLLDPDQLVAFDDDRFLAAINQNELVKLTKKTVSALFANVGRSDPDWEISSVKHFLKTQMKGKMEALVIPVKAGQTLATCHDLIVILLGACNRYVRAEKTLERPDNIFIHSGTSTEDLSKFVQGRWRDGIATTNDYTAFDSSQMGDSVWLTTHLWRRYGIPEKLIELYRWWKTHTVSDIIGVKQTGRDTGEPGTFDENTDYNLAIIATKYRHEQLRSSLILLGGDDSAIDSRLSERTSWALTQRMFKIVCKTETTSEPQFCSWCVTSEGVFKDPTILMLKLLVHEERGSAHLVAVSYAYEAHYAYHMGERFVKFATEEQQMAQSWLVTWFHRHLTVGMRDFLFGETTLGARSHSHLARLLKPLHQFTNTRVGVSLYWRAFQEAESLYVRKHGFMGLSFVQMLEHDRPALYTTYLSVWNSRHTFAATPHVQPSFASLASGNPAKILTLLWLAIIFSCRHSAHS